MRIAGCFVTAALNLACGNVAIALVLACLATAEVAEGRLERGHLIGGSL